MPNEMNQAGDFRVQITEYYLTEKESGSVAITAFAKVLDLWIPAKDDIVGYWEPWQQYDVLVRGDFWIVGTTVKGNKLNDKMIQSLVAFCEWDGTIQSVHTGNWKPCPCRMTIQENTWEDNTTYKMSWPSSYDSTPGGQRLDDAAMKRIETKHASAMRAIAGNVKRNTSPPSNKPAAAPVTCQLVTSDSPQAEQPSATKQAALREDGIPF